MLNTHILSVPDCDIRSACVTPSLHQSAEEIRVDTAWRSSGQLFAL